MSLNEGKQLLLEIRRDERGLRSRQIMIHRNQTHRIDRGHACRTHKIMDAHSCMHMHATQRHTSARTTVDMSHARVQATARHALRAARKAETERFSRAREDSQGTLREF